MALRAVPDHPKFAHLKELLGLRKGVALGYLECLWIFAAKFAPNGNLSRYRDCEIESWVEWDGAPGRLIDAVVASGWATRNPDIHLWEWKKWSGRCKRQRRTLAIRSAGGEASSLLRTLIYERDGWKCRVCGCAEDITLDHIFPVSLGGLTEYTNLQVLCRPCNSSKRDRVVSQ